jgi:hypothetical protein
MIEVFICTSSPYVDVGHWREMTQHTYCSPELASSAESQVASLLKGRIVPQDDMTVLRKIVELAGPNLAEVQVYDMSRTVHRLKAFRKGVKNTPAIIIDGVKFEGAKNSLSAIQSGFALRKN